MYLMDDVYVEVFLISAVNTLSIMIKHFCAYVFYMDTI
jgi:hypothetical protein